LKNICVTYFSIYNNFSSQVSKRLSLSLIYQIFYFFGKCHHFIYFNIFSKQNNNNNTYIHTVQERVSAMLHYMYFICIYQRSTTCIQRFRCALPV